jgi:hypothetical protein
MPPDRLLTTLIRSLQTYTNQQDTPRLLSTAASLLSSLQNPLNITLLTSQLLTAPSLWHRPDGGLHACLRLMGVFHAAAQAVANREDDEAREMQKPGWYERPREGVGRDRWVKAVMKGADEKSPRWKCSIVFGGLLLGFGMAEEERLNWGLRAELETALVTSINLGLEEIRLGAVDLAGQTVSLVLNHTFPLLSDLERSVVAYDALLPVLLKGAFFGNEGLEGAYFLAAIELDLKKTPDGKLLWTEPSPSFRHIMSLLNRPLVASLGPLSRLISHTLEHVQDSLLIQSMLADLNGFCKALLSQWRQNRLSSVPFHAEALQLADETQRATTPQLWKLLRSCLFAITIIFRGCIARLLSDRYLASDQVAPEIACQVMDSLRCLYFITTRIGTDSFTQYTFVYLSSIDILASYPPKADEFLHSIAPFPLESIPNSPLDRTLSLFFLNMSENFTLLLPTPTLSNLLIPAALPYLAPNLDPTNTSLFEASHALMLATLCSPHAAHSAAQIAPAYVDSLFAAFPGALNPRQFRLAMRTLMRVSAPPSLLISVLPDLQAVLLEMLHFRASNAPTTPLPQAQPVAPGLTEAQPLSERAVLILAIIDSVVYLPPGLLQDTLPLAASLLNELPPGQDKNSARARFWEVMSGGDMDPERALVAVGWWTRSGRADVVGMAGGGRFFTGDNETPKEMGEEEVMMSGALGPIE